MLPTILTSTVTLCFCFQDDNRRDGEVQPGVLGVLQGHVRLVWRDLSYPKRKKVRESNEALTLQLVFTIHYTSAQIETYNILQLRPSP